MNSQAARTPAATLKTERRLLMIEQGGQGGIADYTAQLTRELAAQGWQVELATADDHHYSPAPGVTVHRVFHYLRGHTLLSRGSRRYRLGWIVNGVRFLTALPRLTRLARRVDLVHVQSWETPALGLIAIAGMRLAGATIVQTEHNTFERGGHLVRTRTVLHRALARLTARTIVHTQADLAGVAPRMKSRVAVIPHGEYGGLARTGGVADREAARAALGIAPDAPVTLVFGQLRTDKGFADLLQALRRVPSLHLLVGGKELGALAAARAELQSPELRERVTVREGFLEMSEAAQLFAATDTVALPYKVASQSGVLLLAYGFQRPVIVYPVGGLTESVQDGETGWICARADPAGLATALADSVAAGWPECRRRGEAGAAFAQERFAWPAIAGRTGALYDEALAEIASLRHPRS
jgi:glycosyltransferase involved in cell wall biosynthesis